MLPLFALNTVLFPGCVLDLQVFEARYLDMVSQCMRQQSTFGVVSILEGNEVGQAPGQLAQVGCEALLVDWQQLANGLLGVRVQGGRCFEVQSTQTQANQLSLAEVQWRCSAPETALIEANEELLGLLTALSQHPQIQSLNVPLAGLDRHALAYWLGYLLPLSQAQKLELLSVQDAQDKLERIHVWLDVLQGHH